jgi:hypothetical protein
MKRMDSAITEESGKVTIMKVEYSWSGHDANGVYRHDVAERTPMQLVASFWPREWKDLEVRDPTGELVAYIETLRDGQRSYWLKEQDRQPKKKG